MYPILFSIGKINFYTYGFFVSLALIANFIVIYFLAKKKGLPIKDLLERLLGVFAVGAIFGHLSYFFSYPDDFSHWYEIFYIWAGLTSFGGIIGGVLAIIFLFKKNLWAWVDIIAIGFWLGVGIWRIGCVLVGDHPGIVSSAWYSVNGEISQPLFESILGFILAGLSFWVYRKKLFPAGYLMFFSLFLYGVIRIIIDQWRVDPMIGIFHPGQIVGIIFVIIGVIGIMWLKNKKLKEKNA